MLPVGVERDHAGGGGIGFAQPANRQFERGAFAAVDFMPQQPEARFISENELAGGFRR